MDIHYIWITIIQKGLNEIYRIEINESTIRSHNDYLNIFILHNPYNLVHSTINSDNFDYGFLEEFRE